MTALEAQKELVQFLLKRLKSCAIETAALRAVFISFTEEGRAKAEGMLALYRASDAIHQKVESQFHDLDELIQLVTSGVAKEEVHKLLEQFDPDGKLLN